MSKLKVTKEVGKNGGVTFTFTLMDNIGLFVSFFPH